VSDNYFNTLGIRPALGRVPTAEESAGIGSSAFAVISDRLWKNRFAGTSVSVSRRVREIAGARRVRSSRVALSPAAAPRGAKSWQPSPLE